MLPCLDLWKGQRDIPPGLGFASKRSLYIVGLSIRIVQCLIDLVSHPIELDKKPQDR